MKKVKCTSLLLLIAAMALPGMLVAQPMSKKQVIQKMKHIIDTSKCNIGVSVTGLDFRDTILINPKKKYPMQSVYKFPVALAILDKVDKGKLTMEQSIHVTKESLDMDTWSPMLKDYPGKDIDISVADLLTYMVSASDNNACDILFWLAGGTGAVNNYIHGLGVDGIAIAATEKEMHKVLESQYTNWCQPGAMARLLQLVYDGKVLSKKSNSFLMKIMTESENSPNRIKGLLPQGTRVAHKTGTSYTDKRGVTAATNDVGIVTLPNGKHYAIVVYVSDYKGGVAKGESVIREISKLAWDHYTAQ